MQKKTFRVEGMHCTNCVMKIESIEDELDGVKQVSASYRNQQVLVEFDELKVSPAEVIAAIKEKGYTVILADK